MSLLPYLHRAAAHENLTPAEAQDAMAIVLGGGASTAQTAALLVALRMKGETADELLGFARAMRAVSSRVAPELEGEPLLDTCGTGGDGIGTFNISTIAAFVAAGAGVKVAKHGNRSISSKCGSADVLESLGIRLVADAAQAAHAIREIGIAFLYAPAFHPAMKHAQAARLELKMRTVFNMLGPLINPAEATVQVVGASSPRVAELMAGALAVLGLRRGFVVHGSDGLDEITTTGATLVFEIAEGRVRRREVEPEDFGIERTSIENLKGGGPDHNAAMARAVLEGRKGPVRDIVLVNTAAALVAVGKSADFKQGVSIAEKSIDCGAAMEKLKQLGRLTSQA
jgi:anthranilate phosphoribosyltransferase